MNKITEKYTSDQEYSPGTVVTFGGSEEVTANIILGNDRLAGVVESYDPETLEVSVIHLGKGKCQVVGRVNRGEMIIGGSARGCAVRAMLPTIGTVLGYALEDKSTSDQQLINVMICRM